MKDLVFLHGALHGSWCWTKLLAELRTHPEMTGRFITLDVPGAGTKRGRDSSDETITSVAHALNDELTAAGVSKAVFIGHSLAGILMPVMAARNPELFSDLIFLQTIAPGEGQAVYDQTGTSLQGQDPERVGLPVDPATMTQAELMLALFGVDLSEAEQRALLDELAQETVPNAFMTEPVTRKGYDPSRFRTTYVLAKRDPVFPPDWQRRFAERLGCARIVEVDTPHEAFLSHPRLLADALRSLIA